MIKVGKVGSNPLLIHGFFEHGRRGRMTIFWIFLVGTLTAFLPLPPAWHQFIRGRWYIGQASDIAPPPARCLSRVLRRRTRFL